MISEDKIQQQCYMWFHNNYCLDKKEIIFAIPNQTPNWVGLLHGIVPKSIIEILEQKYRLWVYQLTNIGMYAGASDLVHSWKCKIYFVEVKKETGKQSDKQKKFEAHVTSAGFTYVIVRSLVGFQEYVRGLG